MTTVHRIDMTKIAKLRERAKGEFQARNGFSLTFLPFVTVAAAQALRDFPIVNASIDGNNIVYHTDINIGIAVALDEGLGLIVPVIRNADEKNVAGLQRSIVDLATRARSRQLKPDEVRAEHSLSPTSAASAVSLPLPSSISRRSPFWEWEQWRRCPRSSKATLLPFARRLIWR